MMEVDFTYFLPEARYVGYERTDVDMAQPLLAGIVTDLDRRRVGQAMGLNVFFLFIGFGLGSLLFGEALKLGFGAALGIFSVTQAIAGFAALRVFRGETSSRKAPSGSVGPTAAVGHQSA